MLIYVKSIPDAKNVGFDDKPGSEIRVVKVILCYCISLYDINAIIQVVVVVVIIIM